MRFYHTLICVLLLMLLNSCVSPENMFKYSEQPDAALLNTINGEYASCAWGSGAWMFLEKIDGKYLVGTLFQRPPHRLSPGLHSLQFNMVGNSLESRNTLTFDFKPRHQYVLRGHREGLRFIAQLIDQTNTPEVPVQSLVCPISSRSIPFTAPSPN